MAIVEPTYEEWTDSFNIENVPTTVLDSKYHVGLGALTSSPQQDRSIQDQFPVVLTIWKRGFVDIVTATDELLDVANCIRLDIIDVENVELYKQAEITAGRTGNIEDVQSVSITPSEIAASNDNIVQIQLEFNVRLYFGT